MNLPEAKPPHPRTTAMSGGSYNYAYQHVEDMADVLCGKSQTPLRRAFASHLRLVSEAMHDIEWVDSSDYSDGDEESAIRRVLGQASKNAELKIVLRDAKEIAKQLDALIKSIGDNSHD